MSERRAAWSAGNARRNPICSVAECDRVTHARGVCFKHYRQLWNNGKSRAVPTPRPKAFTKECWSRWWEQRFESPDSHAQRLKAGIDSMRQRLERRT